MGKYKWESKEYYKYEIITKLSEGYIVVLTGESAMVYSGLSKTLNYMPDVLTDIYALRNLRMAGLVNYCYEENIDYVNYLNPMEGNSRVLIPTKERAIIENIKHDLEFIEEGSFLDSLLGYVESPFYNRELLEEVAKHFNVSMEKVDKLVEEALELFNY